MQADMPWFEGRFVACEGFQYVEPLFQRELALLESEGGFDAASWEQVWEEIWARGVALLLPDGTHLDRELVVHVYPDGSARFRY
jgi:hypothetical protein